MSEVQKCWRVIVVGGHTRSIGKTQLVCDVIATFPEANWIAGKITQYGHGFCVKKGKHCNCAPDEHICAMTWETGSNPRTDSGRFLAAGARKSFWLRTKQGFLAEGIPLLREALNESDSVNDAQPANLILESNTLLDFVKPSLYLMVLDPEKPDFKQSARQLIDRASAFVWRRSPPMNSGQAKRWPGLALEVLQATPNFSQREGEALPQDLCTLIRATLSELSGITV